MRLSTVSTEVIVVVDLYTYFSCDRAQKFECVVANTPLPLWFHTIMVASNAKSSMSAKALERDLEVTYKTAWRMLRLIREALDQGDEKLKGDVEADTGYIGGVAKADKRMRNKSVDY